jgi:hypothetical protein
MVDKHCSSVSMKLYKDYAAAVSNRTQLESQLKENEAVQKV